MLEQSSFHIDDENRARGNRKAIQVACSRQLNTFVLKKRLRMAGLNSKNEKTKVVVETALKNHCLRAERVIDAINGSSLASLESFEKKQDLWDRSVFKELSKMSKEYGVPIHGGEDLLQTPRKKKRFPLKDDDCQRFLYDSNDLLESLKSISEAFFDPGQSRGPSRDYLWETCPLGLKTLSLQQLRDAFPELDPRQPHVGVEDPGSQFMRKHEEYGQKLLKQGTITEMEVYLRQGCAPALRPRLYKVVLSDEVRFASHQRSKQTFASRSQTHASVQKGRNFAASVSAAGAVTQKLDNNTNQEDSVSTSDEEEPAGREGPDSHKIYNSTVVDRLHALDLELIRNNDNYFVFEDLLKNVLPRMFRDHMEWLETHSRVVSRLSHMRAVPYYGFALKAAPLAYLYRSEEEIINALRSMFARYWCQLNVVRNSPPNSNLTLLPNLCSQFERLMSTQCPEVLLHMLSLNVSPLEIAFPWIHLAFSNALPVEELLSLWDRILGFDSLLILPVLAAAIFQYRGPAILRATTEAQITNLMKETANIKVVALLQSFLFL